VQYNFEAVMANAFYDLSICCVAPYLVPLPPPPPPRALAEKEAQHRQEPIELTAQHSPEADGRIEARSIHTRNWNNARRSLRFRNPSVGRSSYRSPNASCITARPGTCRQANLRIFIAKQRPIRAWLVMVVVVETEYMRRR
jgi:hypothetical protein